MLLIAGEASSPGSVTASDIVRAIQLGHELDGKAPPKDNLPMDGTFIPLAERVKEYRLEMLLAELTRRREAYRNKMSSEYEAMRFCDGYTSEDVEDDRVRLREEIRVIEVELSTRNPLIDNVSSIGGGTFMSQMNHADTLPFVGALSAKVEVDIASIECVGELLSAEDYKKLERLRREMYWEVEMEIRKEENAEVERLLYIEVDEYFASMTPEQAAAFERDQVDRLFATVNPKRAGVPFIEQLERMTTKLLKAHLVRAEKWHTYLQTDQYAHTSMIENGATASEVRYARDQAFAQIQQIRRELNTRPPEGDNVTKLREA
jgi:hypothetical protein